MDKQEGFPFYERADESQKNAIVIMRITNPKIPDDNFDSLSWVLRARSRDEKRPSLCGLFSDGQGKFVSTDGHRMHIAEIPDLTEKIPAGVWLYVHADKKKISIREAPSDIPPFPEFTRISDLSECHKERGMMVFNDDDTSIVWRYWDLTGIKSNINYLIDICKDVEGLCVFSADPLPPCDIPGAPGPVILPVFFCSEGSEGKTKKALLMPIK
jgi:hypothetical protein